MKSPSTPDGSKRAAPSADRPVPLLTPGQVAMFFKDTNGNFLALTRRMTPSLDGRRTALPGGYPDIGNLVDKRLS